ncbi:YqzK family protein [Paenibacillus sp. ACRRX]|uniref:DUF4227 family protein n=1 Tax=Paenibacillus sp. ACRRX TaxID=2918206 RepID=UPI001EF4C1FB|nr:DUF4227 family protein [Paenibacillus sp. ACRRX]MCG7406345.1 YqzK family protein [Paenibacillus sp. ACRRX]
MIVSVRRWAGRLRFVALFLVCTYAMVQILGIMSSWIAPVDKYKEPQGRAIKVFHSDPNIRMEPDTITERLRLFYWMGE